MKRKAFTLVELLVVIAIIALLMGILMPALARVRQIAYRMLCGSNLAGIGKAMLIYSNDYEEEYPKGGGPGALWGRDGKIPNWDSQIGDQYGAMPGAAVTISCSLYLLMKYADLTAKQFVCKGDVGTRVFRLSDSTADMKEIQDVTDVWDFGDGLDTDPFRPGNYCTYSYHHPYNRTLMLAGFPIISVSNPASPVCADRNPYLDKNSEVYLEGEECPGGGEQGEHAPTWDQGNPTANIPPHYVDDDRTGNSACHQREGQNVLFNDQHVSFEKYPNVGIAKDNIWKDWPNTTPPKTAEEREVLPSPYCQTLRKEGQANRCPKAEKDAFLVGEVNEER
ncbi:MAG: type II secretion system protein [Planctomycetota bacterium]|jgi:prepilin-type N-terminal cleavage/methylation domain-containing protein